MCGGAGDEVRLVRHGDQSGRHHVSNEIAADLKHDGHAGGTGEAIEWPSAQLGSAFDGLAAGVADQVERWSTARFGSASARVCNLHGMKNDR